MASSKADLANLQWVGVGEREREGEERRREERRERQREKCVKRTRCSIKFAEKIGTSKLFPNHTAPIT